MNTTIIDQEIDGHTYRIGKLNGYNQDHVARKMAPGFFMMGKGAEEGFGVVMIELSKFLADMPRQDYEEVMTLCMQCCSRMVEDQPVPIMPKPGVLQFQDIDFPTRIKLAMLVIKENIGNFFLENLGGT